MEKQTLIKVVFIIIFFIAGFSVEFIYRNPLYEKSVTIAETLQDKFKFSITFFKIYTWIGVIEYAYFFLILLFFPISYCFTYFLNLIVAVHICNYTKLLYGQGRPFLRKDAINKNILMDAVERGYGNPSGHSFQSTSNLLGLAQVVIDFWELGPISSTIIYIITAILIFLVNFSRVILGVHSINQTILGDTYGFIVFFVIFKIIQPHLKKSKDFFEIFLKIKFHVINGICFLLIIGYIILGAIVCNRDDNEDYKELKNKLIDKYESPENKILNRDAIYKCFSIIAYFGMSLGMTVLSCFVKKNLYAQYESVNNYKTNSKKKWYIYLPIRFLCIGVSYIPYIAVKIRPGNMNIYLLYIIGSCIPNLILGFLFFGPNFIINITLEGYNIINSDIKNNIDDGDYEYRLEDNDEDNLI